MPHAGCADTLFDRSTHSETMAATVIISARVILPPLAESVHEDARTGNVALTDLAIKSVRSVKGVNAGCLGDKKARTSPTPSGLAPFGAAATGEVTTNLGLSLSTCRMSLFFQEKM